MLDSADEIFLLSTTRDVQGVHRVRRPRAGGSGPVTRELMELWASREAEHPDP